MKVTWRAIRRLWISLGIGFTVVFAAWSLWAFRATAEAHAAAESDAAVIVERRDGTWKFTQPARTADSKAALIFFPGGLVDPVAYAPLLRAAALAGHDAYMVELPRRGAFGGAEAPELAARIDALLARREVAARWVAAGHSRGAVVASHLAASVAPRKRPGFAGLILIGTTHPRDVDLSLLAAPVTKIAATRDGIAKPEDVERNRAKLPPTTNWVWIEGGNHSQFGWYGFQPADRFAQIDAADQRRAMIGAVLEALARARPL